MMKPEKFRKLKERKLKLFSKLRLRNIFPGRWPSIFKGSGFVFAGIKDYEPGDDLQEIDLVTLVRTGKKEIVLRKEKRQLKTYIFADFRKAMRETDGLLFPSKPEIRDIATGLCLFSAQKFYSPVGFSAFAKGVGTFFPCRMGERHCEEIANWIIGEAELFFENARPSKNILHSPKIQRREKKYYLEITWPIQRGTNNFQTVISYLTKRVPFQSLVFFISDFQDEAFEGDFTTLLRLVAQKFDFVPIVIRDPLEKDVVLKKTVRIAVRDTEGSGRTEIYLTPKKLKAIQRASREHLLNLRHNFRRLGIDFVVLDSPSIENCARTLSKFFYARRMARR